MCGAEQVEVEGVDEGVCGAGQVEVEGLLSTTSRRARLLSRPAILSRRERGLVSSGQDALNMQAFNMQGTIEGGTQGTVEGEHTGYRRGRQSGCRRGRHSGHRREKHSPDGRMLFQLGRTPSRREGLRENERSMSAPHRRTDHRTHRTHQLR